MESTRGENTTSRFVGVDELAAAFKVQTGRPVAATQLEILEMKTAEF